MSRSGDDLRRREALGRLRAAVDALAGASAAARLGTEEQERLLAEFRVTLQLIEELLFILEHQVRGPLTVVKGRAQLLRRQALSAPQPDVRLIAGLNEIDGAVARIVANLDHALGSGWSSTGHPFDGDRP